MMTTEKGLPDLMPMLATLSEQELGQSVANGIYLGLDVQLQRPVFLEFGKLMNPHVFVCGMSGSGKTYLLKSLAVKLASVLGMQVVCIDFTGEYSGLEEYGIERIDLSMLDEPKKVELAEKALSSIAKGMRKRGISKLSTFVVLDESWKLLENSAYFNSLLREGRKYGVGVVMATQLISDIDMAMLNNVSTVFVFRLQDEEELEKLAKSYGLDQRAIRSIQSAGVGTALVLTLNKRSSMRVFVIERVAGYTAKEHAKLSLGEGTYVEIDLERFEAMLSLVCGENANKILEVVKKEKTVSIDELIAMLLATVPRLQILALLRKLGIKDKDIAESFARVLAREG